ncbi:MAG: tRNA (cytidine(34)-2'-O)-methyltransferase [Acidobacteria bacterium]|nr:tRNA (cytidine(34)-2'-O)-methyltransferase [Acidobacteriota bacterium]
MIPLNTIHVALVNPEIHPNTGNIARLCAANNIPLHLVGNPGFRTDERSVKRAGLDYWPFVDLRKEADLEELKTRLDGSRMVYFSARADRLYTDFEFLAGDCLVFGPESKGLPERLLSENVSNALKIPMISGNVRSLNLATSVGIAVYEALRQILARSANRTL